MDTTNEANISNVAQSIDRKVRLQSLLDKGAQWKKDINQYTSDEVLHTISALMKASDDINAEGEVQDRIENTSEVLMDAYVMKMNHELLSTVMVKSSDFTPEMLIMAFKKECKKNDRGWDNIADIACSISLTVNAKASLLGCVDVNPMVMNLQKERQKRRSLVLKKESQPDAVTELKQKTETSDQIMKTFNQIEKCINSNENKPVPLYKLITDPHDFMKTVDNGFQLAFIGCNGVFAIDYDENGEPLVSLTSKEERDQNKNDTQMIMKFTMDSWQKGIEMFNIEKPFLQS